jgi:hypothetical protein
VATRGDVIAEDKIQNFIFTFGCKPGAGVLANTSFAKDTIALLMKNFNIITGEVVLPDIFSSIVSSDAIFEISSSSLSRKLALERKDDLCGFRFFFYIKDTTLDNNKNVPGIAKIRKEFEKLAELLEIPE